MVLRGTWGGCIASRSRISRPTSESALAPLHGTGRGVADARRRHIAGREGLGRGVGYVAVDGATVRLARGGIAVPIRGGIVHAFAVQGGCVARRAEGIDHVSCEAVDSFFVDVVGEGDESAAGWTPGFQVAGKDALTTAVVTFPVEGVDIVVCLSTESLSSGQSSPGKCFRLTT